MGTLLSRLSLVAGLLLVALPAGSQSLPGGDPATPEQVHFYHPDTLGSVRAVTDINGEIVSRSDYLPFGEQIPPAMGRADIAAYSTDAGNKQKFTGKERDAENGLDYFGARYFSGPQGRFTSADPAFVLDEHVIDPQQWNRYAYVRNNPFRYVDRDGEAIAEVVQASQAEIDAVVKPLIMSAYPVAKAAGGVTLGIAGAVGAGIGGAIYLNVYAYDEEAAANRQMQDQMAAYGNDLAIKAAKEKAAEKGSRGSRKRENDFTGKTKDEIDAENAARHEGQNACDRCEKPLVKVGNKKGEPTPPDQLQRHHRKPLGKGGPSTTENAEVLCPGCHKDQHKKPPKTEE